MSNIAITHVLDNSEATGSARLVMIAIADRADDQGKAWPSRDDLARRCKVSPKTVTEAIRECERLGELAVVSKRGAGNTYYITALSGAIESARAITPKAKSREHGVTTLKTQSREHGFPGPSISGEPVFPGSESISGEHGVTTSGEHGYPTVGNTGTPEPSITHNKNPQSARARTRESKPRQPNPLFDVVAHRGFGFAAGAQIDKTAGARIGKILRWLKATYPGANEKTLTAFYGWYEREFEGISAPRHVDKFAEHFTKFHEHVTARKLAEQKTDDLLEYLAGLNDANLGRIRVEVPA